jgi:hypothetical protein
MQYSIDGHPPRSAPGISRIREHSRNVSARLEKMPPAQRLGGRSNTFREIGAVFADSRRGKADGAASFFFRLFNAASDVRG